jgi:hypothetical protein
MVIKKEIYIFNAKSGNSCKVKLHREKNHFMPGIYLCGAPWVLAPERNTRPRLIIKYYFLGKNRMCSFWSETSLKVKIFFHNFWSPQWVCWVTRPRFID